MAFLDPNQEELLNQPNQGPSGPASNDPNQAPSSAGDVGGANVAAQPMYSPATPTSGTSGTGFQNLSAYLDANQGNQLASQVGGRISGQASKAQNDLRAAQEGFRSSVDQNTVQSDQENVNRVISNPTQATADDTASFQKQLNANYGGPQDAYSFAPFSQATTEGQNAYRAAKAAQSEGGRLALLDQYFGNPNYTQGQKSLDVALFMGGDQSGIDSAIQQTQNFPSEFQTTAQDLTNYASQGATSTAAARGSARGALGIDDAGNLVQQGTQLDDYGNPVYQGAIGDIYNAVNDRVGDYNSQAATNYGAVQNALSGADLSGLTPDQIAGLGDLAHFKDALYGVDPSQFLTQLATNATPNTVISPEEQAKLSALMSIAGMQNTFAPNSSLAGTAPKNPFIYDNDAFKAAVESGKNVYNDKLAHTIVNYTDPTKSISLGTANPGQYSAKIMDAIASLQASLAQAQAAPAPVGPPGTRDNRADIIANLQAQIAALQAQKSDIDTQYGVNSYLKGAL